MLHLSTIRYMGSKAKLLDHIMETIALHTSENDTVCDLMAGSNAVSYALKEKYRVITNDVQEYSYIISLGVIKNNSVHINSAEAEKDLSNYIEYNYTNKEFSLFEDFYSGTYFSKKQCVDIDAIRYAISKCASNEKQALYLTALMCAMCKVQSTPGHFAQYMPADHKRIIPLQQMDLKHEFYAKCDDYKDLYFNNQSNECYCMDFHDLFKTSHLDTVKTLYLDSPYSQEQYSRFYHILETLVKYDYPEVNYKAKYRSGRFMSDFCYKAKVQNEFESIISFAAAHNMYLVISYSTKGLLPINELESLCRKYYPDTQVEYINYKHSTQGKGTTDLQEVIISCY